MKGVITVEVPDEAVAARVEEMWRQFAGPGDEKPTPQDYFKERLEDVVDDELRIALLGWPMQTHVEVHGWFETPEPGS